MVELFMSKGFSYFDSSWGYNGGKSEEAMKTAIVDRYPRESFQIATKCPVWTVKTKEEARNMIHASLKRTGAGYIDFYLLHNLGQDRTKCFDDFGMWDYIRELKEQGLVRHIGFSIHDKADAIDKILTEHPEMEFVQFQPQLCRLGEPDPPGPSMLRGGPEAQQAHRRHGACQGRRSGKSGGQRQENIRGRRSERPPWPPGRSDSPRASTTL